MQLFSTISSPGVKITLRVPGKPPFSASMAGLCDAPGPGACPHPQPLSGRAGRAYPAPQSPVEAGSCSSVSTPPTLLVAGEMGRHLLCSEVAPDFQNSPFTMAAH